MNQSWAKFALTVFIALRLWAQTPTEKPPASFLIEPGVGVGKLKLGDTQERAFKLFPSKPNMDQQWDDDCGIGYNWVDIHGNVFVRFRQGHVFQIESATTRYRTAEGLGVYAEPEKVRRYYKGLHAYMLLGLSSSAIGDRPLVFWVDHTKGIAFAFAYYPAENRRYLYKIIVFKPSLGLCPEGSRTDSPKWHELPPYSLELPSGIAHLRPH